MNWILVSEVALDEKNGAGMRAILPYLKLLPRASLSSLYLFLGAAHKTEKIKYVSVPYWKKRGLENLSIFLSTFFQIRKHSDQDTHFLIVPNTIRDVLMGIACLRRSPFTTLWIMDDFIPTYITEGRVIRKLYHLCFAYLYRSVQRRVVVSTAMGQAYLQRYGVPADFVLGRTLPEVLSLPSSPDPQPKNLRFVYVGSFLDHYFGPFKHLKKLALELDFEIDLYGMNPPPEKWLQPGKISYRGTVPTARLLSLLQSYHYGLITYSFDPHTELLMSLSFPSKLIDYLGATLPVLTICPPTLSFTSSFQNKKVGVLQTENSLEATRKSILMLQTLEEQTYREWRKNAQNWANSEFKVSPPLIRQILAC